MTGRNKCEVGCECGKHNPAAGRAACAVGCTCGRHSRPRKVRWDSPDEKRTHDREYARLRRAANPEANREAARRWNARNPGYRLAYKYGMSLEDWGAMFQAQEGLCYLCNEPLADAPRGPVVDHDHSCCRGERSCGTCVRGLACQRCNYGVSQFGDDPERMRRVADNLEMANRRLREPAARSSEIERA